MSNRSDNNFAKVFFALWPTAAEQNQLAAWQTPLKHLCGGRAMRSETLHTTLIFIGEIDLNRLESLKLAAQNASVEGFKLCFDTARYWGHNHIVHAAPVHVPQPLLELVSQLEQNLAEQGFKFDHRSYKPHVTLLRNAHWSDTPLPAMQSLCWQIRGFALVQSMPQEYRILARFPLNSSDG